MKPMHSFSFSAHGLSRVFLGKAILGKARRLFRKRAHPFWKKVGIFFQIAFERRSKKEVRTLGKMGRHSVLNPIRSLDYDSCLCLFGTDYNGCVEGIFIIHKIQ